MSAKRSVLSLAECRNPNGTWNGAKTMAKLTGRTESDVLTIWRRIRTLNEECNMQLKDAAEVAVQEHDLKRSP